MNYILLKSLVFLDSICTELLESVIWLFTIFIFGVLYALCAGMLHFTMIYFIPAYDFQHYSIPICIYNKIKSTQNIFI